MSNVNELSIGFANRIKIFLADDDPDDCMFFNEALQELPLQTKLFTVNDGE